MCEFQYTQRTALTWQSGQDNMGILGNLSNVQEIPRLHVLAPILISKQKLDR